MQEWSKKEKALMKMTNSGVIVVDGGGRGYNRDMVMKKTLKRPKKKTNPILEKTTNDHRLSYMQKKIMFYYFTDLKINYYLNQRPNVVACILVQFDQKVLKYICPECSYASSILDN